MRPSCSTFTGSWDFPLAAFSGQCSLLSSYGGLFPSKTKEFFQYGVDKNWDKLFPMLAEYERVMTDFDVPTLAREGYRRLLRQDDRARQRHRYAAAPCYRRTSASMWRCTKRS